MRHWTCFASCSADSIGPCHPGWKLVADRQAIPYSTALISTRPPSDRTLERGRELAARLGW
jgi:hypothetical protein